MFRKTKKSSAVVATESNNMNSEWQHMFGTDSVSVPIADSVGGTSPTPPIEHQSNVQISDPTANMSLHERSYIQCKIKKKCVVHKILMFV